MNFDQVFFVVENIRINIINCATYPYCYKCIKNYLTLIGIIFTKVISKPIFIEYQDWSRGFGPTLNKHTLNENLRDFKNKTTILFAVNLNYYF